MSDRSSTAGESPHHLKTINERENVKLVKSVKLTGFTPRPIEKLARKKRSRTSLDIEINHRMRFLDPHDTVHYRPTVAHHVWMEAGRHDPPLPFKADASYNSNIWRNFRQNYGIETFPNGSKVSELVASLYPLNMPAPSRMNGNTFSTFLRDMPLVANKKLKAYAVERAAQEVKDFHRLKLRSEMRYPPLDERGAIVPPTSYKKYLHRLVEPPTASHHFPGYKENPSEFTDGIYENDIPAPPPDMRIDMFGQEVPIIKEAGPHLYKLSYKLNHPNYRQVKEAIEEKRADVKMGPYLSTSKAF